jgi:hypothetical protein
MRLKLLSYLNALHKGIIALEVMVDELIQAAEMPPNETTDIMLTIVRDHRVKILEMQGQFAALKKVYSERYHREA